MARTLEFTVTGEQKIHCAGCEERIGNVLRRLPGIKDVRVSHQDQRVVVTFDPTQVMPDTVRATLEQLGYHV
jgi:Cu+-exporting ATPase